MYVFAGLLGLSLSAYADGPGKTGDEQLPSPAPIMGSPSPVPSEPVPLFNFSVTQFKLKLNFRKTGKDMLKMSGRLERAESVPFFTQPVMVSIGRLTLVLNLDERGRSADGNARLKINRDRSSFTLLVKNGTFAAALAQSGLENANAKKQATQIGVSMSVDGIPGVGNMLTIRYSAKKDRRGTARL